MADDKSSSFLLSTLDAIKSCNLQEVKKLLDGREKGPIEYDLVAHTLNCITKVRIANEINRLLDIADFLLNCQIALSEKIMDAVSELIYEISTEEMLWGKVIKIVERLLAKNVPLSSNILYRILRMLQKAGMDLTKVTTESVEALRVLFSREDTDKVLASRAIENCLHLNCKELLCEILSKKGYPVTFETLDNCRSEEDFEKVFKYCDDNNIKPDIDDPVAYGCLILSAIRNRWYSVLRKYREYRGKIDVDNLIMQAISCIADDRVAVAEVLGVLDISIANKPIDLKAIYNKISAHERAKEGVETLQRHGAIIGAAQVAELISVSGLPVDTFLFYFNQIKQRSNIDSIFYMAMQKNRLDLLKRLISMGYTPPNDLLKVFSPSVRKTENTKYRELFDYLLNLPNQTIIDESIQNISSTSDYEFTIYVAKKLFERRKKFPEDNLKMAIKMAGGFKNMELVFFLLERMENPKVMMDDIIDSICLRQKQANPSAKLRDLLSRTKHLDFGITYRIYRIAAKKGLGAVIRERINDQLFVFLGERRVNEHEENINLIYEELAKLAEDYQGKCALDELYVVELVARTVLAKERFDPNVPITHHLYNIIGGTVLGWSKLFPNFNLPTVLTGLSPYGFNPEVYQDLIAEIRQVTQQENDTDAEVRTCKLAVLFDSSGEARKYLQLFKANNPGRERPVHDACIFELPKHGLWNIPFWRQKVLDELNQTNYKRFSNFLPLAAEIESQVNRLHTPLQVLEQNGQKVCSVYKHEILQTLNRLENLSIRTPRQMNLRQEDWKGFISAYKKHYPQEYEYYLRSVANSNKVKRAYLKKIGLEFEIDPGLAEYSFEHRGETITVKLSAKERQEPGKKRIKMLAYKAAYAQVEANIQNPLNPGVQNLTVILGAFIERRRFSKMSYETIADEIVTKIYGNVKECYQEFALACARFGILKEAFLKTISKIEDSPRVNDCIPQIVIDGGQDQLWSGYRLEKMAADDLLIALAGKFTGCCQSIGGLGNDPAEHALHSTFGGIYRIMTGNKWVAQCWVSLTKNNELIFDSIEWNQAYDKEKIMQMYEKAAKKLIAENPMIVRVVFGSGGNTPKNHDLPLQEIPENGYASIIGYKKGAYDSKNERFVLAEQSQESQEREKEHCLTAKNDCMLIPGTDTHVKPGNYITSHLSLNPIVRNNFFARRSRILQRLQSEDEQNPLLEEGYCSEDCSKREHYGEHFITFNLAQEILQEKVGDRQIITVNNNQAQLCEELAKINLAEGEGVPVYYVEGVHAAAAYIIREKDSYKCLIVDSENDNVQGSELCSGINQALPNARIICTTAHLQRDYFSCSTFAIKSLSCLVKHSAEIMNCCGFDEMKPGDIKLLKPEQTPARLLKMSQTAIYEIGADAKAKRAIKVPTEVLDTIVSTKKNLTLRAYLEKHRTESGHNVAAVIKKYSLMESLMVPRPFN